MMQARVKGTKKGLAMYNPAKTRKKRIRICMAFVKEEVRIALGVK
jgi:hypothetical protein